VLQTLQAAGKQVIVLHDTPAPNISIPDCLAEHADQHSACDTPRRTALRPDPVMDAVRVLGDHAIDAVDLNDHICRPTLCEAVVGGVVVYFDETHLTATYSATLAPYLEPALLHALG
jgi:hypothetical protein